MLIWIINCSTYGKRLFEALEDIKIERLCKEKETIVCGKIYNDKSFSV